MQNNLICLLFLVAVFGRVVHFATAATSLYAANCIPYCMKIRDVFFDCATVVGSCIGVGFLSGKEASIFFGNFTNVFIFAICFFTFCFVVRKACAARQCKTVQQFFSVCFGKGMPVATWLFCLCSLVCAATLLAGVDDCLRNSLGLPKFVCSVVVAICCLVVLCTNFSFLKAINALSVVLIVAYLVAIATLPKAAGTATVSKFYPVGYAAFSVATILGVLVSLGQKQKGGCCLPSAICAAVFAILAALAVWCSDFSLSLPLFGRNNSVLLVVLGCFAVFFSVVASICANLLPVLQAAEGVFVDNKNLLAFLLVGSTCALSFLGFDFALKYGYAFVSLFGFCVFAAATKVIAQSFLLPIFPARKQRHTSHRPARKEQ